MVFSTVKVFTCDFNFNLRMQVVHFFASELFLLQDVSASFFVTKTFWFLVLGLQGRCRHQASEKKLSICKATDELIKGWCWI